VPLSLFPVSYTPTKNNNIFMMINKNTGFQSSK